MRAQNNLDYLVWPTQVLSIDKKKEEIFFLIQEHMGGPLEGNHNLFEYKTPCKSTNFGSEYITHILILVRLAI